MIKTLIYFILSNLFLIEIVSQNILTIDDYKEKEAVYYSNEEFDEWIIESVPLLNSEIYSLQKEGKDVQLDIDKIGSTVKKRLELGYCISDDALITSAMHYRYFEYDLLDMRERKIRAIDSHYRDTIFAYQKTIDYIDELLPLLYKRDFVKYTLLDKKSYLLLNQYIDKKELYQLALENYLSYRKAIKKEAAEWEIAHKYAVKDLGDLIFQQSSDIKKTESIYNLGLNRHFLSYEKDKESLNKMKEIYIEIAKANINLHSGNLAELSRKTIPDSLTNVLFPYLQSEIEAAGGNFQEYLESAGYLINHPDYKRRTKKDKQKGKR